MPRNPANAAPTRAIDDRDADLRLIDILERRRKGQHPAIIAEIHNTTEATIRATVSEINREEKRHRTRPADLQTVCIRREHPLNSISEDPRIMKVTMKIPPWELK